MEYVHGKDVPAGSCTTIRWGYPRSRKRCTSRSASVRACTSRSEARDASGKPLHLVHRGRQPAERARVLATAPVKLVDFGIAKAASASSETEEGTVKGKYGYMSPEQCLGGPARPPSDIFTLGILLWEMTVGRRLYKINGELVTLQRIV